MHMSMRKGRTHHNATVSQTGSGRNASKSQQINHAHEDPYIQRDLMGFVSSPLHVTPQGLLHLQRTLGNRKVERFIQARLKIGASDDTYEREADQMADRVMRMPASSVMRQTGEEENEGMVQSKPLVDQITPLVQRQADSTKIVSKVQRQSDKEEEAGVQRQIDEDEERIQAKPFVQYKGCSVCGPDDETDSGYIEKKTIQRVSQEEAEKLQTKLILQRQSEQEHTDESDDEKLQAKKVEEDDDTYDRNLASSMESRLSSSLGGGRSLPNNTRSHMESAFGADFSGVRIHTDQQAVQMNQELGAKAFTHGQDIYFNANQYSPDSYSGRKLMAHELTHVIQQSGGRASLKSQVSSCQTAHIQAHHIITAVNGPAEAAAGRRSSLTFRATAPRGTNIAWSIQGANPTGATLGGTTNRSNRLTIPRASTGGTITIRAADAANPGEFAETNIAIVEIQQPTFALAPVPAVIAPAGAVFPANTVEASVGGNTATAAAVTVPAGRPVTWSIVGNRRGATIDPATGVITPSVTQTGPVRIRAADNAVAAARNEQTLTVRAYPRGIRRTIRTGTTAAAGMGTYGSVYDHIFQSSGGSLNGVNVSERVFNASNPFNVPFAPVAPGAPNIWTLNAAGRMVGDFMFTPSGTPGIDVNRFLPSPPEPGLPQVWSTPQILFWRSEQAGVWVPFDYVQIHFILRRARGGGFETVTINNGVAAPPEAYAGPALAGAGAPAGPVCPAGTGVSRVSFAPGIIAADGNAMTTTAATARVRPGGSAITWSFPGENFGANIVAQGNPALISAGNVASRIRVRAELNAHPNCFAEGWLHMREVQIGPIRFRPGSVRTGANTAASVSTRPGRRVVTWTIQGPNLGAAIVTNPNNTATITAGAQIGRITVRATDQRDVTSFTEASLVIR